MGMIQTMASDHDRDNDTVDGNDTSEDNREDSLHNEFRLHNTHRADTYGSLCSSISATDASQSH